MSPQLARNHAARDLYEELRRRFPQLDRDWLRSQINSVVLEELRLIRRDLLREVSQAGYYHGERAKVPEDAVLSARRVLSNIDRRIEGRSV